jgi:GH25 family lysozyme M1 (1,4-beta-N-acetylmuramidase)
MFSGPVPAHAAPSGYPVTGIDVSAFQGQVDWAAVAAGGARFAYLRASEQDGIPDAYFPANYAGAKENGLLAGAYHRARPELSSGRAQADVLVDAAGYLDDGRTLPPMLDIEWPRSDWVGLDACYNMTPSQLSAWIRDFVNEVAARTGRVAMIYTNTNWWRPCTNNDAAFGGNPLFIASYTATPPPLPAGWRTWSLWQYADSGALPGDQDVFNGDAAGLRRLVTGQPLALRAHANGGYVTAGATPLVASAGTAGDAQLFDQIDLGGGYVALRSRATGRVVTAENAGAGALVANRTAIGAWERFRLIVNADGSVSLQAAINGRYVTAEGAGAQPLIANRTAIGAWERFDHVLAPGTVALWAMANLRYVTAESAGAPAADRQPGHARRLGAVHHGRPGRRVRRAAGRCQRPVRDGGERRSRCAGRQPYGGRGLGTVPADRQRRHHAEPARRGEQPVRHRGGRRRAAADRQPHRDRGLGTVRPHTLLNLSVVQGRNRGGWFVVLSRCPDRGARPQGGKT